MQHFSPTGLTIFEIWLRTWEKIPQNNKVQISIFRHFVKNLNFDIPTRRASSWDPGAYVWQLLYDSSKPSLRSGSGHEPTPQNHPKIHWKNGLIFTKMQILKFRQKCGVAMVACHHVLRYQKNPMNGFWVIAPDGRTHGRTDGQKQFYDSPYWVKTQWGIINLEMINSNTVHPLKFVCHLFCEFRNLV